MNADLFGIFFGSEWRIAGEYAKIVAPFFFVRFVVSSVSNVNNIFEYQKLALSWQIMLLILSLGVIFISSYYGLSFRKYLIYLSIVLSVHYLALYVIIRRIAYKGKFF